MLLPWVKLLEIGIKVKIGFRGDRFKEANAALEINRRRDPNVVELLEIQEQKSYKRRPIKEFDTSFKKANKPTSKMKNYNWFW